MFEMRIFAVFVCASTLFADCNCQYSSSRQQLANLQQGNGNGWDIRLAVPGEPGSDYPTLSAIPKTSFSCAGKQPGYYADLETSCQVFRICTTGSTFGFQSFLCPNGTLFNQQVFVCDWWMNVNCQESQKYFVMNNDKYGNLKLGPHMMSDIKNMLTHPTRNPYDKGVMKNNYVVMQVYKPPSGQLFPNGALRAGYERALSNSAKQIQPNYNNNALSATTPSPQYVPASFNNGPSREVETFQRQSKSASTPSPQYVPATFNNGPSRDVETFQRQSKSATTPSPQYVPATFKNGPSREVETFQRQSKSVSTPSPQYVPVTFNNGQSRDVETFQRQSKSDRLVQNNQIQNQLTNGHTGRITQPNTAYGSPETSQNYNQQNLNKLVNNQAYSTQNTFLNQRNQLNAQYKDNKSHQVNGARQAEFGISYQKEHFTNPTQQSTIGTASQFQNSDQINEVKQNLVSHEIPSTVITKTLTFDRHLKGSNQPNPISRLTIKSWIIKPNKSARLISEGPYVYNKPTNPPPSLPARTISEPTSYGYNRPTNPPLRPQPARIVSEPTSYVYNKPTKSPPPLSARKMSESTHYVYNRPANLPLRPKPARIIAEPTAYVYNKPTSPSQLPARLISEPAPYVYNKPTSPPHIARLESEPTPYYYNKPPTQAAKITSESGYVYNRPTVAAKLTATTESPHLYLAPTTRRSPALIKLYVPPTTIRPTLSGRLYLAPVTTSRPTFARQEVAPIVQPVFQSIDQEVSPTAPTPVYLTPQGNEVNKPSFTYTKQSRINANHNNLTFTDILTKEKLDITVHDIVKDTSNVLNEQNSQLGQLRQNPQNQDYPLESYLPPEGSSDDHVETISIHKEESGARSGKLVAPSTELEPPNESFENTNDNDQNPLAKLPFYKDTSSLPANTIERTVSLKISIPEKTAAYLFKQKNDSDYDRLEILNTGSSNYLVLTNNNINKLSQPNFIPIGQLVFDKNSNVSNSQALVNSFLADSLNVAKEYNNIVGQNIKSKQYNNEDLSHITNKVSQLTSSQYSQNSIVNTNNYNNNRGQLNELNQNTAQIQQNAQINQQSSTSGFTQTNRQTNGKQIYSGQLYQVPVPEVTNHLNNEQDIFVPLHENSEHKDLQESNREALHGGSNQQSSAEVEIVKSHSLTLPSVAAKLRAATSTSTQNHEETAHEIFRNLITGDGLTAQVRDKIIGSITHPYEDQKVLTYKKDQSYYLFTKLDENIQNEINNGIRNNNGVTFQFVPSVGYEVNDEKEQQRLLNAFQINEYGVPKVKIEGNQNIANDVDYTINHSVSSQSEQYRSPDTLYAGPSSYSAPQSTVGRLETQQQSGKLIAAQNNNILPARQEEFNEDTGYAKITPSRQFIF